MEAAEPIMTPSKIIETKFLNLNLIFNNINYECCFYELNEKIKIDIMVDKVKYENIINFNEFKNLNKYFRMFDNLKELEQDLIGLSNSKKIEIINVSENEILLCINVLTLDNNKTIIQLKKTELKDKELINLLFKEIENIKNENKEIKKENEEIKNDLKKKDLKINKLEEEINNIKNILLNSQKSTKFISNFQSKFQSSIILNENESDLILNQLPKNVKNINLVFSSLIDGKDINKLKNAYLNRPNLVFVLKTKKGKRFGAYARETFLDEKFNKKDKNAFLFSLDNNAIIKPKIESGYSIWNNEQNSINFGGSTDLRIFYDFTSNNNYTCQGSNYYDYKNLPDYVLNGEYNFSVDILEIFQICFA